MGVPSGCCANLRFKGTFPAEARVLRAVRDQVAGVARECGVAEGDIDSVRLAVTEVVTNVINHAYADQPGEVRVRIYHESDEFVVVIADDGVGMSPRLKSPGLGLGLPVVAASTKRVDIRSPEAGGTEVRLVFDCPA